MQLPGDQIPGNADPPQRPVDHFHRSLEFLRNDLVGPEPVELVDFQHVLGAHQDREIGIQRPGELHRPLGGGRVGDRHHHRAGGANPDFLEHLAAGGIPVNDGLSLPGRAFHAVGVQLQDPVRDLHLLEDPRQVSAVEAEADDQDRAGLGGVNLRVQVGGDPAGEETPEIRDPAPAVPRRRRRCGSGTGRGAWKGRFR